MKNFNVSLFLVFWSVWIFSFSASASADVSCDIELDNGASFQLNLTDTGHGQYLMNSFSNGLTGQCKALNGEFNCNSTRGDLIVIRPSEHRFQDQTSTGENLEGSANCD